MISLRSRTALVLSALLLPPLGLALLWMRSETRALSKVLGSLLIALIGVVHLVVWFGLRVEMAGSGMRPIFSFYKPEKHYAALEASRAAHQAPVAAPPVAQPVSAAAPAGAAPQPAADVPAPVSEPNSRNYWSDFRGPGRQGRYDELRIRLDWPAEGLPLLWRQPVGGGYASFVVAEGRAFTIEQRRSQEVVTAYDVDTGRELWAHGWEAEFQESMGGDGPRATPAFDSGRLYALGASGELRCLDAKTGKRIWTRNILADTQAENLHWGMAAAPLIVDDKVVVLPGGSPGKSVAAYNKMTGEPVWKSLDDKQAYSSPLLATLAGQRQIVVFSARRAMGITVEEGALLWDFPWQTEYDINSAQPLIVSDNRVFISSGYGRGAAVLEITRTDKGYAARPVWENTNMKNRFNSSVLHEGYIYGFDEGIMACVDARTGQRAWKGGRYGYGQAVLASGHLVVLSESGDVVLVKATPARHEEVARFSAIEGKTWNHPAISNGRLLVRNTTQMAAFRIAP